MEPLFLIDAYGIIYRSYFAFISKPLRNPRGQNISAAFGFFRSIFQLWDGYKPTAMAAVFDSRTPTFRHLMYDAYKATRQKTPEDLYTQIPLVEELLAALGIPMLRTDGYEADDLIATLAKQCRAEGRPCYIISSDKDLLQLVGGSVRALRPDRDQGFLLLGPAEVAEEWGVTPEGILDYLSLTGDASDNIPGVAGVGDKTALKLLNEWGSFDAIWENIAKVQPDSLRAKLEKGRESAMLSRTLVTLASEVPLTIKSLDELAVPSLLRDEASPIFMREGMKSLATRKVADGLDKLEPAAKPLAGELFSDADARHGAEPEALRSVPEGFSKPGKYETVLSEEALHRWIDAAMKADAFSFDCETDSLDEMHTMPVGFSLALEPGSACYIPITANGGNPLPPETIQAAIRKLLARTDSLVIGQNLKFDMHVMENWACPIMGRCWDTMIAAWLLESDRDSLKLENLGEYYLGFGGTPYEDVAPKGTLFSQVSLDKAGAYAAEDADLALRLKITLEPMLRDKQLLGLFETVEMPVLRLLARMERNGILVDPAALASFGAELERKLGETQKETYAMAGREFNMNSPKQLQEVLFVERKLSTGKKTKTGFSTDVSVLEELAREDPLPALILKHRGMQRLKSTYVDSLLELSKTDPRIHTHYVQSGTATGRLSSRDPNLQNIPVRDEDGRRIRQAFVAAGDMVFISADYAQIELVVFAHLAADEELCKAFISGDDVHKHTAALIFGKSEAEVTPSERRAAKTINFGVIYGMGAFRLAQELGIPRAEAQRFIDAYFARYNGVARFIQKTIEQAQKDGAVYTILGRQRPIAAIHSRNANERQGAERIAVNTPIQGSAADIMKLAMLKVDAMLMERYPQARLLLQVHDELIIEAPAGEAEIIAAAVKEAMASAYKLSIPLRASVEIAKSWGGVH